MTAAPMTGGPPGMLQDDSRPLSQWLATRGPARLLVREAARAARPVHVLFVRRDSVYHSLDCEAYDSERDARTYPGAGPIVAHPPCGTWGRLRGQAAANDEERALAPWAVEQVRKHGGVVEHPAASSLWHYCACLKPGRVDEFGGHLLPVWQGWFGHKARKSTWLYIVGCSPLNLPAFPLSFDLPEGCGRVEGIAKSERERTPVGMALWLIELARRCAK